MDAEVICNSTTLDLKQVGLEALGDIVSLKTFASELCKQEKNEQKSTNEKRQLLQALLTKSGPKRTSTVLDGQKLAKRQRDTIIISPKPRKVFLGWLHFNFEKQRYVAVRVAKGGGTRQVELPLSSNKEDVINIGKDLFFPDGCSSYGPSYKMSFGIANYQEKDVTEVKVDGVQLPFTLQRYIQESKLSRVRLYLTSKIVLDEEEVNEEDDIINDISSDFTFNNDFPDNGWESDGPDDSLNEVNSSLEMESLKERRALVWQQDQEYKTSLAADKAKEESKKAVLTAEIELAERQELLRVARSSRIPPEPTDQEDVVMIQVRRVHQGLVKRAFKAQERAARIYDWVGSLSPNPEYFRLADFSHTVVKLTQRACEIKSVLYMEESSSTLQVASNPVTAGDPLVNKSVVPETLPVVADAAVLSPELPEIGIAPPAQLLEEDTRYIFVLHLLIS